MLSILLYGRNDSHGYNLHKRGALSLNALAAVLTDPDDEIIFVDYNTPDELPTFPEAIGDTLTDAAKARLRVIRVRPSYHRQFAGRTRLFALEPQSRNIAARRANPANRWLLSTNTDMVFCPQDPAASLTSVVAGLDDGFYHLPRFEVPEGFWERLDRKDPDAAIGAMRANGQRFHLNEIVWGISDNLFEAPGDFQLFTRADYAAIEGFDERMLLGWHADSNIAKRMRMLRGEVSNAFPAVAGYHCGHTRQATALHGGGRTQNDFEVFVSSITDPVARHQAGAWGAPDEVFEEIRLDRPDLYSRRCRRPWPTQARRSRRRPTTTPASARSTRGRGGSCRTCATCCSTCRPARRSSSSAWTRICWRACGPFWTAPAARRRSCRPTRTRGRAWTRPWPPLTSSSCITRPPP